MGAHEWARSRKAARGAQQQARHRRHSLHCLSRLYRPRHLPAYPRVVKGQGHRCVDHLLRGALMGAGRDDIGGIVCRADDIGGPNLRSLLCRPIGGPNLRSLLCDVNLGIENLK